MNLLQIPKDFDLNEWIVIISTIFSFSVFFYIRGKFPTSIILLLVLYAATVARIADHILAGPPLDLYDLMDSGNYDMFDILTYLLYGPFIYIFIYLYVKLTFKGIYLFFYIVACSIFGVVYEWIFVLLDVFTFNEWYHVYSFPVYLIVQSLTILYYHLLKYFICKKKS